MKFAFDEIAYFYIYIFKDKIEKKFWKKLILLEKVVLLCITLFIYIIAQLVILF